MTPGSKMLLVLETFATCCVVAAVVMTMCLCSRHVRENRHVALRTYTIRILLMVPVYSISALLPLLFRLPDFWIEALSIIQHLYEAIVIFSFLQFILVCAGGPEALLSNFQSPEEAATDRDHAQQTSSSRSESEAPPAQKLPLRHIPPLGRLLPAWRSPEQMLGCCVIGTLSYPIVGIVTSAIQFVLWLTFRWGHDGYPTAVNLTMSICRTLFSLTSGIAVFFLAELAVNMYHELKFLRPHGKFLSVKLVVFATFWQHLILQSLGSAGALEGLATYIEAWRSHEEVTAGFTNFLICCEMLFAAGAHLWVYPPQDSLTVLARLRLGGQETKQEEVDPPEPRTPMRQRVGIKVKRLRNVVDMADIYRTAMLVRSLTRARKTPSTAIAHADIEAGIQSDREANTDQPRNTPASDGVDTPRSICTDNDLAVECAPSGPCEAAQQLSPVASREGTGSTTCPATDPQEGNFHVSS
eukprot:TRINITY_DN22543_c0_g1_i1.p1 TRINITY_DN22543_c0_g1~~TRINITY_DN22543_c0_g1_i1.p1  ORF type:complete len:469 (+),score=63.96 TRINITY_DN22543_c0_g1_i1:47-1453(+)